MRSLRGTDKAGFYEFWTIENEHAKWTMGRRLFGLDPGDRFREMEHAAGYEKYWAIAKAGVLVRPSYPQEVEQWLNGHPGDAKCAQFGEANGLPIMIVRDSTGYKVR